nr:hypothetical protein [Tanacetum cinerariifolium]
KPHFQTPYELFRGRTPALSFMRPFGCHVTILNTLTHLGKFDGKSDERFFVGYFTNSKVFREYNTRTRKVEKNLHIKFLENKPLITGDGPKWLFDIDTLTESMNYVPVSAERPNDENSSKDINIVGSSINTASSNINTASPKVNTVRLNDDYFGANNDMKSLDRLELDISNLSTTYPIPTTPNTRINKDYSFDNVIDDMQSGVQTRRMTVTTNEQGFISAIYEEKTHVDLHTCLFACFLSQEELKRITNALKDPTWVEAMQEELLQFHLQKVWTLVDLPRGCTQEEGIDYDEVFVPVARIEAIRLFLAYASFMGFLVYQMDVKSAFLYGRIEEEVYVCQPSGFKDPDYPDKVNKVEKALYGLHQAPRAWYETLASIFWTIDFAEARLVKPCSSREKRGYSACTRKLTFFLGLQVKQKSDGIFICQDKYVDEILRKFKYEDSKPASTPMDKEKALLKDSDGDDVDVHLYRKQTMVATATTEAEYVAPASCYGQVLWIQNQLLDYRISIVHC